MTTPRPTVSPGLPGWLMLLAAASAGAVTGLGFAPYRLWPLTLLGAAALTVLIRLNVRERRLAGAGLGYLFGLGFLAVSVSWLNVFGWWVGWLLIVFEAGWFALVGFTIHRVRALPTWPVWSALAWAGVEFCYSRAPFGGFGWTRLAYAMVDAPLAGLFPVVGVAGVSALTALTAQLLAGALLTLAKARGTRLRPALVQLGACAAVLALAAAGFAYPLSTPRGWVDVGMVQGDIEAPGVEVGRAGIVTNNHVGETVTLMAKAETGQVKTPQLVLWPENSTDTDPLADPTTNAVVNLATQVTGVPILVGAITRGPGEDERQTTALWWHPDQGVVATGHKRNLVPFGEYIPFRSFLLPRVPILELTGSQSVAGTTPNVLRGPIADGRQVSVGIVICFELAYDQTVYDVVSHGGQLVTVQSNNASYQGTGQVYQQWQMTRVRAMETRREIVVATTNSFSGLIDARGRVHYRSDEGRSASATFTVPLRDNRTPAVRFGRWIDTGLGLAGLVGLVLGVWSGRRPA